MVTIRSVYSRTVRLISAVLTSLIVMLVPSLSLAATAAPAGTSGQGLSISPPLISTSANPGQSVTITIRVQNISGLPLILSSTADDFGAKGEDGQPQLLLNETTSTRYSLKYWIAPIASPTIVPGATVPIPVTINIPANAEPGGHYGAIQFTGKPPSVGDQSGVAISASIAVLVLFTVNGPITQHLTSVGTIISHNGKVGTSFPNGPFSISEQLQNDGDVHVAPSGLVVVRNIFGMTVASLNLNPKKGNILPGSIRKFTQTLDKKGMFGPYTVTGTIAYGSNKSLVLPKTTFWVIPYTLILIVIVIVILLFFILRFALRRYNRHVIEQARRR